MPLILAAAAACSATLSAAAFALHGAPVPLLTWVDNLYFLAHSTTAGLEAFEVLAAYLSHEWNLQFKAESKIILRITGASQEDSCAEGWQTLSTVPCLGHLVSGNGSIRMCWQNARRSAWKTFFGNAGLKQRMPLRTRLLLLARTVKPVLEYRFSRWPPQSEIAREVHRTQKSMYNCIAGLKPCFSEDGAAFVRRRAKVVQNLINDTGSWVQVWINRCTKWNDHIRRHPEELASQLLAYRPASFLVEQRLMHMPRATIAHRAWNAFSGRTGTRAAPGIICQRWESACEFQWH